MNKFEFISQILENQKMNSTQKERFLKLASKEISLEKPSNKELWKEIEKIKKQLINKDRNLEMDTTHNPFCKPVEIKFLENVELLDEKALMDEVTLNELIDVEGSLSKLKNEQNIQVKPFREQENTPEPNPKHVADFMSLFNKRDGLKYLTHDYDENSEFNIDKFLISAYDVFKKETKFNKLNIPTSLWRIVQKFAFDSQQAEWTSITEDYKNPMPIAIGWATKELRDWSKKKKLHPIRNEEYKKIINDFKRITRVEAPNLEKLINTSLDNVFKKDIDNFEIEKINLSKADFYSHVGYLKTAIETIFEEIQKRSDSSEKKKLSIKYERSVSDEGYYLRKISIKHHNSFPSKVLELILQEWQEKGNMGKIKENLNGYCHWSVETEVDGTPTKVNILKEKETPEYEIIECKPEELPEGFTHILTFYYK